MELDLTEKIAFLGNVYFFNKTRHYMATVAIKILFILRNLLVFCYQMFNMTFSKMNLLLTTFTILMSTGTCITYLKEFTSGNNLFTAAVYKELHKPDGENVLISPLSVEIVLALMQTGGKGETAQEIQRSLHLPSNEETTKTSLKSLLENLKRNKAYKLHTANKGYVKQGLLLKDPFKNVARDVFQADFENIDFSHPNKAADTINNWVKKQTENKIRDLIDPKNLNSGTSLVLVNALYFKGNWVNTFEVYYTEKEKFYKNAKDVVEVDFMHSGSTYYEYAECPNLRAKFLKMDFKGDNISMVIVLPDDIEGLSNLEKQAEKIFTPHPFQVTLVSLRLPKFKTESKTLFAEILNKLGVGKAFSKKDADFSGITGTKGDLMINEIVQKTFIDVNENGVEVAVATDVDILTGSSLDPPRPKHFFVDHPFMYYIKYEDVILFAGRVASPES